MVHKVVSVGNDECEKITVDVIVFVKDKTDQGYVYMYVLMNSTAGSLKSKITLIDSGIGLVELL